MSVLDLSAGTAHGQRRSKWYWTQIDPGKLELLAQLLQAALPGAAVSHGPDLYPDCWCYRIEGDPRSGQHHRVIVMREFFEENDWAAMQRRFRDWNLAKTIRGRLSVLITKVGADVDIPETGEAR